MSSLEFIATIDKGHLTPPASMGAYFRAHQDKQVKVKLSENVKNRSLKQNSFFHGVVLPHVREFRMDQGDTVSIDQVKEDLISEFAPQITSKNLKGETVWRQKRTHEMDTKEMADFCTYIMARLSEFGFHFPMQGDVI